MRRRGMALLCAVMMLCSVGCDSVKNAESDTQIYDAAETEADKEADGKQADVTALSLMKEYNQGTENSIEDNYRTTYEVFLYSFYDSNGDGIGDLKGLEEKLDYINDGDPATDTDLGCDSIWLMPVMPSTTYHKYDVTDYCDIDAEYGTLADFKDLVEACHERGIRVIIDLVMNHTSSQHTWFQTAAAYLESLPENAEPNLEECPYVDYYNFSKEKASGYSQLADTDWYYEAQFWSEMPDLNLGNEAVRQEFSDIVDFWLELGADGFRLDAAKEYYSGTVDANVEVLSWFNAMVKEKNEDAYIVAEVWNDLPTYAKYYASGIDSCFDFSFADSDGVIANVVRGTSSAASYGRALVNLQETLSQYSDSAIDAPFYTNHDMARGAGYYSGDNSEAQTKIAQAMNLFMTGNAFLYYGEELGMKGSGKDENKRAPMYWSEDADTAGMCTGPADMDAIKMKYGSLEEQQADGNSIYYFVQQAISLRNQYPEIARGTVTFEENISDDQICGIRKTYDDSEILLIYNISDQERTVDLGVVTDADSEVKNTASAETEGTWTIGGELLTAASAAALEENTLTLPPYTVVLLTRK